jgi:hypothetical protein
MKHAFAVAVLCTCLIPPTAFAEIPDIDSSGWATDPRDHGMSPRKYIQAEMHAAMTDVVGRTGLNQFFHFPGLIAAFDRSFVSPNNDTLYSFVTVNTREGFTLELPEVDDRFMSIQIVDENHMTPFHLYGGGKRSFERSQFETDYVLLYVRTGTDGTPEDIRYVQQVLQPQYRIFEALDVDDIPRADLETLARVRAALVEEYGKLDTTADAMQRLTELVEDWEFYTRHSWSVRAGRG